MQMERKSKVQPVDISVAQKRNTVVLPQMHFKTRNVPVQEKRFAIRPESPRTRQAAQELGIDIENFTILSEEDFNGPDVTQHIREMRYEHYFSRLQSDVAQIQQRRREIINEARRRQQQQFLIQESQGSVNNNNNQTMRSYSEAHIDPLAMTNVYNKAVSYLRNSHDQPQVREGNEIFEEGDSDGAEELEMHAYDEINKYNKLKQQKQKEARLIYEGEVKKLVMMKELKDKEERLKKNEKLREKEKEKQKKLRREEAQAKLDSIKDKERQFRERKAAERRKIKQRLELAKQKQAKEEEERQKIREIQEQRNQERKEKMERHFQEYQENELQECIATMENIENKFLMSQERQNELQMERIAKMQEKQQIEAKKYEEVQNYHVTKERDNLSRLVQKMVEKEENIRQSQVERNKQEKKRKQELKMKEENLKHNKDNEREKHKAKMERLNERFQRIEENLAKKKQEQELKIKLQQEERRLKQLDKIENNERQKRREEYRLQQILEREQKHKHNLELRKNQSELLKRTKQEVTIQYKQESDRIFQGLTKVSDRLFPNGSDNLDKYLTPVNKQKGFKILKSIFNKEDVQGSMAILDPPKKEEDKK